MSFAALILLPAFVPRLRLYHANHSPNARRLPRGEIDFMMRIAIVGGGPGGLITAYLLEQYCSDLCEITLFEAGPRLGGKVVTKQFTTAPIPYEAGVAELYDYSHFGPDPVRQLVKKLGLATVSMSGPTVILGNAVLRNARDIRRHFGQKTALALQAFHQQCRDLCTPTDYYEGHWQDDNQHPWAEKTFREVLDEISDETARKYVEVAVRSDLATEPHLTSALNGLKNVLMDDPRYLRLYSIQGGIEGLTAGLAKSISSPVLLESPVVRVGKDEQGTYRLTTRRQGRFEEHDFDLVVLALPNYWLERIEWGTRELRLAMQKHLAHYDQPAHYLRISALFKKPFWRPVVPGAYFMTDAFGGCCVYDEGARHACDPYGVLGWLLAGNDAMALCNLDDRSITDMALDSLPAALAEGRRLFLEGRVHRWVGTISGLPGGQPTHGTRERHLPEPQHHAGLFLVGDYLFDSTINGVYDSADFVTDMLLTLLRKKKYASAPAGIAASTNGQPATANVIFIANGAKNSRDGLVDKDYHDLYDGERPYEESWKEYFCELYTIDLIRTIWGWSPPYRLLDCGSASGLTLAAFAKVGVEAWGVENSEYIHRRTPSKWRKRNLLGDVRDLPFPDNSFDFVYDTCLCHLPEEDLDQAIRELFRVCRVGVFYGGYTSDMTVGVIEAYDIFDDARSLFTLWEWSELFLRNGFRVAASDPKVLGRAWKIETDANEGDVPWYPDAESMRYCFYSKPNVCRRRVGAKPQATGWAS
jgi:monoamine oxidase/SAM-dependent methyltransferase